MLFKVCVLIVYSAFQCKKFQAKSKIKYKILKIHIKNQKDKAVLLETNTF